MVCCPQVYLSLCPEAGGQMGASLEEVVARLSRVSKVGGGELLRSRCKQVGTFKPVVQIDTH